MKPRIWNPDWQAFHEHVEQLRHEHEQRTDAEAVHASLAAFARWGVDPPASFFDEHPEARTLLAEINATFSRNAKRCPQ
jgi:hypothetical protein